MRKCIRDSSTTSAVIKVGFSAPNYNNLAKNKMYYFYIPYTFTLTRRYYFLNHTTNFLISIFHNCTLWKSKDTKFKMQQKQ